MRYLCLLISLVGCGPAPVASGLPPQTRLGQLSEYLKMSFSALPAAGYLSLDLDFAQDAPPLCPVLPAETTATWNGSPMEMTSTGGRVGHGRDICMGPRWTLLKPPPAPAGLDVIEIDDGTTRWRLELDRRAGPPGWAFPTNGIARVNDMLHIVMEGSTDDVFMTVTSTSPTIDLRAHPYNRYTVGAAEPGEYVVALRGERTKVVTCDGPPTCAGDITMDVGTLLLTIVR